MNDLESIADGYNISLTIIGKGPQEEYLKTRFNDYNYPIIFKGEQRDEALDLLIKEEIDIGLAIGTSAYEFAKRGKPTIMSWTQDREYKARERNDYKLLYESEQVTSGSGFGETLKRLIENYEPICRKDYEFILQKSPERCANKLLLSIKQIESVPSELVLCKIASATTIISRAYNRKRILSKINLLGLFSHLR